MRNKNMMIVLALLAAAAIFYFMKQSDFMKPQSVATEAAEMETSMDVQESMLGEEDEPFEEEEMIGEPASDEDEIMTQEDVD